jgi:hypothetical protein
MCAAGVVTAQWPHAQWWGGAASPGSPMNKVPRARWREHRGGGGNMLDKAAAEGAHPSGGSTVRGKEGGGSSTFQGGDGVLWLERASTRLWSWGRRRWR